MKSIVFHDDPHVMYSLTLYKDRIPTAKSEVENNERLHDDDDDLNV